MQHIEVSHNGRFLVQENQEPFFYLADTAWELFHRLTLAEARRYLAKRAQQGFTVIQAVALAELDGLRTPNANGDLPLIGEDPTAPNEAYFQHIDAVVDEANRLGLTVAFLPTWGDKVNQLWGVGPVVFTPENAEAYGRFLGRRYARADLIWVIGGDRPIDSDTQLEIWRALASGLGQGDNGSHLKTFHPTGERSSSEMLHREPWLDFNMIQSGHGKKDFANYEMVGHDYRLAPVKPCMDGELNYENHPINWKPEELGHFNEHDVRQAVYWSLFAGGHGVTYGCNDVWQMADVGRDPVGFSRNAWHEVLSLPGANQMQHARNLLLSRPYTSRVPDQSLITSYDCGYAAATRDESGSFALIYLPHGGEIHLDLSPIGGRASARWYSPRTGEYRPAELGECVVAPSGLDWILAVDRM